MGCDAYVSLNVKPSSVIEGNLRPLILAGFLNASWACLHDSEATVNIKQLHSLLYDLDLEFVTTSIQRVAKTPPGILLSVFHPI
jgi:hypothetical protein